MCKLIKKVETESFKADLLAVMTILAGDKFNRQLVEKYVRKGMLMNSPIYKKWIEEERREASKEATQIASVRVTKESIIELLEGKFDFVSKDIRKDIEAIDDLPLLSGLFRKTAISKR